MTYEEAVKQIPVGKYRHFKGNEYEVIGIARHSETTEPMVVYGEQSYYNSLNDYDWSKACPAAGCRNQDGEE